MSEKKRLDCLLFDMGLAESREKAKTLIMMGQVYVDNQKSDKPGTPVSEDAKIEVRGGGLPYVSRGGLKLEKAMKEFPIEAQLILCCMRGETNHAENLETVKIAKKFLEKGVCAVDLAGNESAYPTKMFEDVFLLAKEQNVPIIIHAGEAAGAESVEEALACGAVRIGHGIHSIESPKLLKRLKAEKIYLELCYSSNLQTQAVKNSCEYPLIEFLKKGILVTINTDNMTVSNTSLKREYQLLKETFQLSDEMLLQLAENSVEAAFLPQKKKLKLKQKVKQEFLKWLSTERI